MLLGTGTSPEPEALELAPTTVESRAGPVEAAASKVLLAGGARPLTTSFASLPKAGLKSLLSFCELHGVHIVLALRPEEDASCHKPPRQSSFEAQIGNTKVRNFKRSLLV